MKRRQKAAQILSIKTCRQLCKGCQKCTFLFIFAHKLLGHAFLELESMRRVT